MIIEKRKVKSGEKLRPEAKMRLATFLGMSAALVLSSCASTQSKVDENSPEISVKKIAEPIDSTAVESPKTEADSVAIQDTVSSSQDLDPGPLGGIARLPEKIDDDVLEKSE